MMRTHSLRLLLLLLLAVTIPILLFGTGPSGADEREGKNDRAVRLFRTVAIPPTQDNTTAGGLYSFEISWVDQATQTYYLADRSNKTVDVANPKTLKLTHQVTGGFRGFTACAVQPAGANDCAGPNG